jgi:glycosyltransferase involved in cell wall biosynthesis
LATIKPKVSIIIGTKNEERFFEKVLESITKQTFQDFEIIVVDDNSTDSTIDIANYYECKIINFPKGEFTYPRALNLGPEHAIGKYLVFTNGHAIPISKTWLSDGLKNFSDEMVAGVYATPLANPEANWLEIFLYSIIGFFRQKRFEVKKLKEVRMGVLGFTNAIIRKNLWEKYHFNEAFERGGEDNDWACHWVSKGYKIIHDPKFKVFHSHNLGLIGLIKQFIGWIKMGKPSSFKAQTNKFK